MAVKLTDEQQFAVDALVCENLVSAAAGSGKTKVLSERITKRLRSGDTSIDRLLIVTFTRAAASQMREKIREALENEYRMRKTKRLKKQLSLISSADICTIDSFCIDLVRRNFFRVQVPPDFNIADENEMVMLKEEVVCDVLEDMYEKGDEDFLDLTQSLGKGKNDEALKDMILKIHDFAISFQNPDGWLDMAVENHIDKSRGSNALFDAIKKEIEDQLEDLRRMLSLGFKEAENAGIDSYVGVFFAEEEQLGALIKENNLDNLFQSFEFGSFAGKKVDASLSYIKEHLQDIHNDAKKFYAKISDLYNTYKSERGVSYSKVKALVDCVKAFSERYMEEKVSRKELEFSDCEYLAYRILAENEEAVDELRDKYEEIYIDEYQDTNPLQDALFTLVSRKARGEANLFIVGDIKQSIYRFRHSDPTLFGDKAKSFGNDENSRKMLLTKNFRSRNDVLVSINNIFSRVMRENTAQVEYNEEHMLRCGAKFPEYDKNKSEIYVLSGNYETADDEELAREQQETLVVARKIREMMEAGFKVTENGKLRDMKYSDVAVLSRTIKGKADMVTGIFNMMDIPAFCDAGNSFFDTLEIRTVVALLKAVDNPLWDIPLASALRSPVFAFDENELTKLRSNGRDKPLYENLKAFEGEESALGEKCTGVIRKLKEWRSLSQVVDVKTFISKLLAQTGYDSFVSVLPGGSTRRENLKALVQLAGTYESTGYKGLYNFIRYTEKSMESELKVNLQSVQAHDSVLVTTIHKSKGLEFPVVFVIGCGAKFNDRDASDTLILSPKGGIGIVQTDAKRRIKYKSAEYMGISIMIKKEAHAEQMRLLYVAMTRAKEKLIMVGTKKNLPSKVEDWSRQRENKFISDYSIRSMPDYLEYIMNSIDDTLWEIHYVETLDALIGRKTDENAEKVEAKRVEGVIKRLEYVYPYSHMRNIPSKMSVSEIKKMSMENEEGVHIFAERNIKRIPSFMKKETKLYGNLRGTAFHKVMENLDLCEKNVSAMLERMVEGGSLSALEKDSIDKEKIERFLASPLADMMRDAKRIWKEEAFTFSMDAKDIYPNGADEKILVQGTIDCLFEDNGGRLFLVDYKTDFYLDAKEIGERYKKQLELYELAVFKKFLKKCDKKYLYLFHNDDIIEV